MSAYRVISVVGPTACGKSALADEVCLRLGGEVVSADSMQVYRGMDIGTAKTPAGERRVPLHCIDLVDIGQAYSAALFARDAHACIDGLLARDAVPVVCGGTGLYVRAALEEMDFPAGEQQDNETRARYEELAAQMGNDAFHALLAERDPDSAALIHPNNTRRVVRAFELLEQGSSYASEHETLHVRVDRYPTLHVGLTMPRDALYKRIDARVDKMMSLGLVEEVRGLMDAGLSEALTSRQAIGYKEIIEALQGKISMAQAVEQIKRSSRRYAKRQYTWFGADKRIVWLDVSDTSGDRLAEDVCRLYVTGCDSSNQQVAGE